jgi:hypothetical protein
MNGVKRIILLCLLQEELLLKQLNEKVNILQTAHTLINMRELVSPSPAMEERTEKHNTDVSVLISENILNNQGNHNAEDMSLGPYHETIQLRDVKYMGYTVKTIDWRNKNIITKDDQLVQLEPYQMDELR